MIRPFSTNFMCNSLISIHLHGDLQNRQRNHQRQKANPCRALVYRDLRFKDVVPPGIEPFYSLKPVSSRYWLFRPDINLFKFLIFAAHLRILKYGTI